MIKRHLEALIAAPVSVTTWNGTFQRAKAEVVTSTGGFKLEVDVTHPLVREYSGKPAMAASLVDWRLGRGMAVLIPEALQPKVEEMVRLATLTDAEAKELRSQLDEAMAEFRRQMF